MIITRKAIHRRAFLKGLGTALALPLLDAMTPALASAAETAKAPLRLAFFAVPNGIEMKSWTPKGTGKDFAITRILKPLEPFRDYLTIVSDTDVPSANATEAREIGGDHFRSSAAFLTQTYIKRTAGADVEAGISLDQLYAQRVGCVFRSNVNTDFGPS